MMQMMMDQQGTTGSPCGPDTAPKKWRPRAPPGPDVSSVPAALVLVINL